MAEVQEVDSWKKAYNALKEERQTESMELENIKATHQIGLWNIQMTQTQLQELMSQPILPPSNKAQAQEIITLQKEKDDLYKHVQELKRKLVGKDKQHVESSSIGQQETPTLINVNVQAAMPAALEMLREYDEPTEESEGPMQNVEPMEFLQEDEPTQEPE